MLPDALVEMFEQIYELLEYKSVKNLFASFFVIIQFEAVCKENEKETMGSP